MKAAFTVVLLSSASFFASEPLWAQAKTKDKGGQSSARERQLQNEIDQLKKRLADGVKQGTEGARQLAEANRRIAELIKRGTALEVQAERALRQVQDEQRRLQRELDEAKRTSGTSPDDVRRLQQQRDNAAAAAKKLQDDLTKASKDAAAHEADRGRLESALMKSLDSSEPNVRLWGVESLSQLGHQASFAVPALEKLRDADSDAKVREAAMAALAKIRAAAKR